MIEEDTIGGKQVVPFAVITGDPVGVNLGSGIGAAWFERSCLGLRRFGSTKHFAGGSLVESLWKPAATNGFENPDRPQPGYIAGVFGHIETHADVALGSKVEDLVGFDVIDHVHQVFGDGNVTIMQEKVNRCPVIVGVVIDVIDPAGVKSTRSTDDAVDFISFGEQEFS